MSSDRPLISCQSLFTCHSQSFFKLNQSFVKRIQNCLVWGRLWLSMTVISLRPSRQWIPLCPLYCLHSEMQWHVCKHKYSPWTVFSTETIGQCQQLCTTIWPESLIKSTQEKDGIFKQLHLIPDVTFWQLSCSLWTAAAAGIIYLKGKKVFILHCLKENYARYRTWTVTGTSAEQKMLRKVKTTANRHHCLFVIIFITIVCNLKPF